MNQLSYFMRCRPFLFLLIFGQLVAYAAHIYLRVKDKKTMPVILTVSIANNILSVLVIPLMIRWARYITPSVGVAMIVAQWFLLAVSVISAVLAVTQYALDPKRIRPEGLIAFYGCAVSCVILLRMFTEVTGVVQPYTLAGCVVVPMMLLMWVLGIVSLVRRKTGMAG